MAESNYQSLPQAPRGSSPQHTHTHTHTHSDFRCVVYLSREVTSAVCSAHDSATVSPLGLCTGDVMCLL
jgi:hypothetical protein